MKFFYQCCREFEDNAEPIGPRFEEKDEDKAIGFGMAVASGVTTEGVQVDPITVLRNGDTEERLQYVSVNLYLDRDGIAEYVGWRWRSDRKELAPVVQSSAGRYLLTPEGDVQEYVPESGMTAEQVRQHSVDRFDIAEYREWGMKTYGNVDDIDFNHIGYYADGVYHAAHPGDRANGEAALRGEI